MRSKIRDIGSELPPGAAKPIIMDDFAFVYGFVMAVTGDGYSYAELEEHVKLIRKELNLVPGVAGHGPHPAMPHDDPVAEEGGAPHEIGDAAALRQRQAIEALLLVGEHDAPIVEEVVPPGPEYPGRLPGILVHRRQRGAVGPVQVPEAAAV